MGYGTTLGPVRARLVARLQARAGLSAVAVGYDEPSQPPDVEGPSGLRLAVWLAADVSGATQRPAAMGGLPVDFEESWTQTVLCQALPRDSADTQEVVDDAVSLLVGEVMDEITGDPTLGLSVSGWTVRVFPAAGWRFTGGFLAPGSAARVALDLQVEATTC